MNKSLELMELVESAMKSFMDHTGLERKPTSLEQMKTTAGLMSQDVYNDFKKNAGLKHYKDGENWLASEDFGDFRYWLVDDHNYGMFLVDTQGYDYPRYAVKAHGDFEKQLAQLASEMKEDQ